MNQTLIKLDIGCGNNPLPGYEPIDIKHGSAAYPLDAADASVDEIRASHVLEHFSHRQVQAVVADWVRALKPGGQLKIAVPDFQAIVQAYLGGQSLPIEGFVMGGHTDDYDHHGSLFDAESLTSLLQSAGLIGITHWRSEQEDCAALPISLNLAGTKPPDEWPKTVAVLSLPRLGFNDFWGCVYEALAPLRIPVHQTIGAFWEQCLERGLEKVLQHEPKYILTLDYDTVFTGADVQSLILAAERHPEADAIAALQAHRFRASPLMSIKDERGQSRDSIDASELAGELTKAATAHFGCTLIRADALQDLPHPWLRGQPAQDGRWSDNRIDPDIAFWQAWERHERSLYVANRVPVGHIERMIRWPDRRMRPTHQHPTDFHAHGKPTDCWR